MNPPEVVVVKAAGVEQVWTVAQVVGLETRVQEARVTHQAPVRLKVALVEMLQGAVQILVQAAAVEPGQLAELEHQQRVVMAERVLVLI